MPKARPEIHAQKLIRNDRTDRQKNGSDCHPAGEIPVVRKGPPSTGWHPRTGIRTDRRAKTPKRSGEDSKKQKAAWAFPCRTFRAGLSGPASPSDITNNYFMNKEIEILIAAITKAARLAFQKLFSNGEHFYYCALLTTGEGFAPVISAWSWEALGRVTQSNSETHAQSIKWSYADSPYYAFGYDEYFSDVKQLFEHRANIDSLNDEDWGKELDVRLTAMVKAMSILDKEGLFAQNQSRRSILINVELMPPDASNVQRALELNNSEDIEEYLQEAAESE